MYTSLAYVYDELMKDIDYAEWAKYIEQIFKENKIKPSLIADLGCGTGSFCIAMAEKGYDMIGIDISSDMLSCAKEKSTIKSLDILFVNQDMVEFELYGTVDVITCLVDSINYITEKKDVKRLFNLVHNYLNPGGIFIFDINTKYKFEEILDNNVFYSVDDDISYIWENNYDINTQICQFDLTLFVREKDKYKRYDEIHYERAYSTEELKSFIEEANLRVEAVYNCLEFLPPKEESERIFFVCKKL